MKKIIIGLISLIFLLNISTNVTGQSRRSYKSKSYKPKTVHVRSYTTKKGKRVSSYKRSRPSSKILNIYPYFPFKSYAALTQKQQYV